MIDSGIGIKKPDQKKLFKLFGFLSETQNVNANGIGLGLYISKKIVEQFGGNIKCESEPGVETRFTFTFVLEKK